MKPGSKSTELYVVIAMIAKLMGLDNWITPDKVATAHEQVNQLATSLQGNDHSVYIYLIATIYVAGRTWLKSKKIDSESRLR